MNAAAAVAGLLDEYRICTSPVIKGDGELLYSGQRGARSSFSTAMSDRGDRLAAIFIRSGRPDPLGLRADALTRIMKPGSIQQVSTMSDRHLAADLNVG
ncbi:MAG: hypothetical protein WAX12_11165 [Candidatus Microthrix subdominans]|jgi:hypothetical protein